MLIGRPSKCPYEVPYEVVQHGLKIFEINRGEKPGIFLIDRLQPACVDLEYSFIQRPLPSGGSRRGKGGNLLVVYTT